MISRLILCLVSFFFTAEMMASEAYRCPLNCNDLIHISLAQNCMRTVTPRDVMNGDSSCIDDLILQIQYKGSWIGNQLGVEHIGKRLKYRVVDPINNNNSCWGEILVSKKTKPIVVLDTLELDCLDPIPGPGSIKDSCGFTLSGIILSSNYTDLNCSGSGPLVGRIHRRLLVADPWNNSTEVDQVINLHRSDLSGVICPPKVVLECCTPVNGKSIWDDKYSSIDGSGYAHPKPILDDYGNSIGIVDPPYRIVDGQKMYLWDFQGKCKIAIHYKDHLIEQCGWSYTIKRHWQIEDWCSGDSWDCYQEIVIEDRKGPEVEQLKDLTLKSSDYNCETQYIVRRPTLVKECGFEGSADDLAHFHKKLTVQFHIKEDQSYYGGKIIKEGYIGYGEEIHVMLKPGTYKVQYEIADACHNYTVVNHKVVVKDDSYAVPQCISSMEVNMEDYCSKRVYASEMDKGSHHTCCGKIHYAVAHKDSVEYYADYWRDHFRSHMSSSQYQRYSVDINQAINEWINAFVFNDYVDVQGCGSEQVVFRVYEACDMDPYPSWFPGNKHQWYCYQTVRDYDCYYVSHYPYMKSGSYNHRPPMNYGTNAPHVDYCYKFDSGTYSWLSSQGVPGSMINTLKRMRQEAPSVSLTPVFDDCGVSVYKKSNQSMSCQAPTDLFYYCDGTPQNPSLVIDGQNVELSSIQFAGTTMCYNPEGNWSSSGPTFGNYNGTAIQDPDCFNSWQPIYCRVWLMIDQFEKETDFENHFGDLEYSGSCGSIQMDEHITEDIDDCGNGTITKTWKLSDPCGHQTTCQQKITVMHRSDFEVIFPVDIHIEDSLLADIDWSQPEILDQDCENVKVDYMDEVVDSSNTGFTIERIWSIQNTCLDLESVGADIIVDDEQIASDTRSCVVRHVKDNGDGQIYYRQLIHVVSNNPNQLDCQEDLQICADEITCSAQLILDSIISGPILDIDEVDSFHHSVDGEVPVLGNRLERSLNLGLHQVVATAFQNGDAIFECEFSVEVTDCRPLALNCESMLAFCGQEDCLSDSLDILLGTAFENCVSAESVEYQYILKPFKSTDAQDWILGIGNRLSGRYPVGIHEIQLLALDDRGQTDSCNITLTIKDCSGLSIEFEGESNYCNRPGTCSSDTLELRWNIQRTCSDEVDSSSISYLFVIKPHQSNDPQSWILMSRNYYRGVLPVGIHRLEMMAIDPYGPADTMIINVQIEYCDSIALFCADSIYRFEISDSSGVRVTVQDFDVVESELCGDLALSFKPDSLVEIMDFGCENLMENDTLTYTIYITSLDGPEDSCQVQFILEDNMNGDCGTNSGQLQMNEAMLDHEGKSKSSLQNQQFAESIRQSGDDLLRSAKGRENIRLYPNPFASMLQIVFENQEDGPVRLEIYAVDGELVFQNMKTEPSGILNWTVEASQLPHAGMYVVKFITTEHQFVRRISMIK